MRQEQLQHHFLEILESSILNRDCDLEGEQLTLSDDDMFRLWNLLGEELGIDLSLATAEQRSLLFKACGGGQRIKPKEFANLLWLMYYAEPTHH